MELPEGLLSTTFDKPTITLRFGRGDEASAGGRASLEAQRRPNEGMPTFGDLVDLWGGFSQAAFAFVGGSVTEGWAHAKSDLDIYVISDAALTPDTDVLEVAKRSIGLTNPDMYICIGQVGQYRADIELWTTDQIAEITDSFLTGTRSQEAVPVGPPVRDLIYRLTSGQPLLGSELWRDARSKLMTGNYRKYLAATKQLGAESMAEDVAGLLAVGDDPAAALAAHTGVCTAIEGVLATRGDFCVNQKWLQRRLSRIDDLVPGDELWAATSMKDAYENPRQYAERTQDLLGTLIAIIEDAR